MSDLPRPTLSTQITQTQSDINGRIPGADSRLPRSMLGYLAKGWAGQLNGLYGYISAWAKEIFPDSAVITLPRHLSRYGLGQKAATFASGAIELAGAATAFVPAETVLERADGVRYQTTTDVTFAGASAVVNVLALTPGVLSNTGAGITLSFVSPVSGVSSSAVVGDSGLTGGFDIEDPEAARARMMKRIRTPPQGGADTDYEQWALEIAGVTRAWVFPEWLGPGWVGVAFVYDGRPDPIPTATDLEAMTDYISVRKPVTAKLYVIPIEADPVSLTIHLSPDTTANRLAVEAQLDDMFAREGAPGGTTILSHINEAISLAKGEFDHDLSIPAANVVHAAGKMPTRGPITWI